jgi:hypothetical protein
MAGLMFKPQIDTRVSLVKVSSYNALKAVRQGQTFLFVDPLEIWPQDPVSVILSDTTLDRYKIVRDIFSNSIDDKLAVPASRIANYPQSDSQRRCDG